jgi:hypothetical protein
MTSTVSCPGGGVALGDAGEGEGEGKELRRSNFLPSFELTVSWDDPWIRISTS